MGRVRRVYDPALTGRDAIQLEAGLRQRIIGQDDNIRQIVTAYQTYLAGLASPGRPIANFLLLGPTGTGKTRMVEAIAETLAGDAHAVIKIDCAEFQHSHEIAKLIGSPPGYLGHRETQPALSQEMLDRGQTEKMKISFVLFDEIEKASDALWNLLLGILDKGTLTLGDNRRVDFSRCMVFMTGNLGGREMVASGTPGMGFSGGPRGTEQIARTVEHTAMEAARRRFSPEFLNRIDKVLVFHPLGATELRGILELEVDILRRRFLDGPGVDFCLSEEAKSYLLEEGTDARYGARHLKRALERSLVHPMANLVASSQVGAGSHVCVDLDADRRQLLFFSDAEPVRRAAPERPAGVATCAVAAPVQNAA